MKKKLSFGCVCSMKMRLLKQKSKIISLLITIQSVNFLSVPNGKMLVSAKSSLKTYVHILYTRIPVFKIMKTLSRSVASYQAIENNNDLLRKEETIDTCGNCRSRYITYNFCTGAH